MTTRTRRAFTLTEMLLVVSLIALLAAILVPSVGRALEMGRRATCAGNLKEIARACITYSQTVREHRGTTAQALPVAAFDTTNWFAPDVGNRANLWLLISGGYCPSPAVFICPSLSGYQASDRNDRAFLTANNCGYSFQSMVGAGGARAYSLDKAASGMVIIGDLNPRFTVGSSGADADMDEKNSESHGKLYRENEGQNIARLDGYAGWIKTPKVAAVSTAGNTGDDYIYRSSLGTNGDNTGQAGTDDDVFLIP